MVGLIALLAVVGVVAANEAGTHRRLTDIPHQLAAARGALSTTSHELASTRSDLTSTESQLQQAQTKIGDLQGSPSDAQAAVGVAADVIGLLKTCLGGVSQTLTDDLDGDLESGLVTLESVEGTCQQANASVAVLGG